MLHPFLENVASNILRREYISFLALFLFECFVMSSFNFQVIERANEDETLGELRARIAAQYVDDQGTIQNPTQVTKKRKII